MTDVKTKTPSQSEVVMRELVMPQDTNPRDTIFGGKIMSWMDMAAAMCAERHCEKPVVTVHISDIDFIAPLKVGNHAIISASLNFVGDSSMVVGVRVDAESPYEGTMAKCTKAYLTFVALDENRRPINVPRLEPETDDEKRRYRNAEKRAASRKELRKRLK